MTARRINVFVSATTADLGVARKAAQEMLLDAGMYPVTQEHFGPSPLNLVEFIRAEIARCDAVICLVGSVFGDAPEEDDDRSYAQLEYDLACRYDKPLWVFLTDENAYAADPSEDAARRERQRQHRRAVTKAHKYEVLGSSLAGFQKRIALVALEINQLTGRESEQRRILNAIPAPPVYFAGRTGELRQLVDAANVNQPSIVAVLGLGGQGKTTLVRQALVARNAMRFDVAFWCTAQRVNLDGFLDEALKCVLGEHFDKRAKPKTRDRITRLLTYMQSKRVILVIDGLERWLNGWNAAPSTGQSASPGEDRRGFFDHLDEFLVEASGLTNGSHLIITSLALPQALDTIACSKVPVMEEELEVRLGGLDPAASLDLLRRSHVNGPDDLLTEVADSYSHHPLALVVLVGIVTNSFGGSLERYLQETHRNSKESSGRDTPLDQRHDLHGLFEDVRKRLPAGLSSERLLIAAAHCRENPGLDLLACGLGLLTSNEPPSRADVRDLTVSLAKWNLLTFDETVILHPLVRRYFLTLEPAKSTRLHAAISSWYELQEISEAARSMHDVRTRFLAIEHAMLAGEPHRAVNLMFDPIATRPSFIDWIMAWGHLETGTRLLGEIAEATSGDDQAQVQLARANMFHQLGCPQKGEVDLDNAIRILEEPGPDPARTINLARALASRGNLASRTSKSSLAVIDFDRAITILQEIGGHFLDLRQDLARTRTNRGNAHFELGDLRSALADHDRAIKLCQELGFQDLEVRLLATRALSNRADVLLRYGRASEALDALHESNALYEDVAIEDCPDKALAVSWIRSRIGAVKVEMDESSEAIVDLEAAVETLSQATASGRDDAEGEYAFTNLMMADACERCRRYDKATAHCDSSLRTYEKLVKVVGRHYTGPLASAHLQRAKIRSKVGDYRASAEEREIGLRMLRDWVCEWGEESDSRIILVRQLRTAVEYLHESNVTEASALLDDLLDEVDRYSAHNEALCIESLRALHGLLENVPKVKELCSPVGRIDTVLRSLAAHTSAEV